MPIDLLRFIPHIIVIVLKCCFSVNEHASHIMYMVDAGTHEAANAPNCLPADTENMVQLSRSTYLSGTGKVKPMHIAPLFTPYSLDEWCISPCRTQMNTIRIHISPEMGWRVL